MFYGTGMIHKGRDPVTYGGMTCVPGLGGHTEIRQAQSGRCNIKKSAALLLLDPALLCKTIKAEIHQTEQCQNKKEKSRRTIE